MDFKIGIMTDSFRKDIYFGLEQAEKLGAQGVQVYATKGAMSPEEITDKQIDEINRILKERNLVISALCGDFGSPGFMDKENNKTRVKKSKDIIDLGLEFGCNIVTTHIGVVPEEENDTKKIIREACIELAEYASSKNAFFAVETGPEKCIVLKDFLDSLKVKGVAVNYDPANLVMVTNDDEVEGVHILKDYIVHTHAKDGISLAGISPQELYEKFDIDDEESQKHFGRNFLELPLGKGGVRFDEYLKALTDIGYNGFLTIEREVGDNPYADIEMAVEFLKNKIK